MRTKTKAEFINGMQLSEWTDRYIKPIQAVIDGEEATDEIHDGFAGFVLDGVLSVSLIHGEEANDWECVLLVEELIDAAKKIVGKF